MTALLLKIACLVAAAFNFAVQAVYFTHMLQLNSYRPERYRKWCRDHDEQLVDLKHLVPFLCIPAMWLQGKVDEAILFGVATAALLLTAILNFPKKAKKPLVVTPRVWRLFAVQFVILALVITGCIFISAQRAIGILGLFSIIVWLWTGVAAYVTLPLENRIAKGFVDDAARILAAHKNLVVIGITGSYGKTSVKNFLHALLSVKYNTLMTPGSYNTTMGVVRTVREMLRPSHEIFLAEMGAKQTGDIKEICDLVHPQYGIISSIGEQHLETFKTVENIIATKFELADALPQDGIAFLNTDNAYIRDRAVAVPVVSYGAAQTSDADYRASDIEVTLTGSRFTFTTPTGESRTFTTKLLGAHNIQNLAGCMAVA
ncbi:MAG: UDP-N-acetylmuramoyl-tripeptide--D-alanyl-D-alanine ligase, partial [Clostridia bacterium]|nr:UDP-N-acetylmuramoyl-tripeptide--D-alanyl-D-alanine ligase [Clostridia bacterium]